MNCVEQIKKCGCLRIGTTADYFPLTFINVKTGNFEGEDLELAKKIGAVLGVKVQFVKTTWSELEKDLSENKFDAAIGGITITKNRCKSFLMSCGYKKTGKTILCRKADEQKFRSLGDVNKAEVRVMYNPGGTNEKFVLKKLNKAEKLVHQENQEIPALIVEGMADVMITETVEAEYYVGVNKNLAAPLINQPFTSDEFGVLMGKENKALLEIINQVIG